MLTNYDDLVESKDILTTNGCNEISVSARAPAINNLKISRQGLGFCWVSGIATASPWNLTWTKAS